MFLVTEYSALASLVAPALPAASLSYTMYTSRSLKLSSNTWGTLLQPPSEMALYPYVLAIAISFSPSQMIVGEKSSDHRWYGSTKPAGTPERDFVLGTIDLSALYALISTTLSLIITGNIKRLESVSTEITGAPIDSSNIETTSEPTCNSSSTSLETPRLTSSRYV